MPSINNIYTKRIFYGFLTIFALIIFSLFNISSFIITCSDYYCYYKKCNKHGFNYKIECFFEKTDSIIDWIILDSYSIGIIIAIISLVIFAKYLYRKISTVSKDYVNRYTKINNELRDTSVGKETNDIFEESLETDEIDPLLML